uniref:uncharacterized protein LOC117611660 n=1 Tax=Osmia lignaria TaxID=473952 RepID=UPI001478B777|nr:uncharacterized protein LOC117611660 [Osmia lignaria]
MTLCMHKLANYGIVPRAPKDITATLVTDSANNADDIDNNVKKWYYFSTKIKMNIYRICTRRSNIRTDHLEQLTTQVFTVPFGYVMLCNIRLVLLRMLLSTVISSVVMRNDRANF